MYVISWLHILEGTHHHSSGQSWPVDCRGVTLSFQVAETSSPPELERPSGEENWKRWVWHGSVLLENCEGQMVAGRWRVVGQSKANCLLIDFL